MLDPVLLILQIGLLLALAAACARPDLSRQVGAAALALAAVCLGCCPFVMADERSLEISHSFLAYVGNQPQPKDFAIETAVAPAWWWLLTSGLFCAGWGAFLFLRKKDQLDVTDLF